MTRIGLFQRSLDLLAQVVVLYLGATLTLATLSL